jgi:hypothetical protein
VTISLQIVQNVAIWVTFGGINSQKFAKTGFSKHGLVWVLQVLNSDLLLIFLGFKIELLSRYFGTCVGYITNNLSAITTCRR